MSAPAATSGSSGDGPPPTLASRHFPRQVRRLLEGILEFASDQLDRDLEATLNDLEQQLFKHAEQARNNDIQKACFESLRNVKRGRSDLVPRFMIGLEASLARIRDPAAETSRSGLGLRRHDLALVPEGETDEYTVLYQTAQRAEYRHSHALWLLGQRFGVLAGAPAYEPEAVPVGPHALCRTLSAAAGCLELGPENRALLYRSYERVALPLYGELVEAINAFLIKEGVLPRLTYVPVRVKPNRRPEESPAGQRDGQAQSSTGTGSRSSGSGPAAGHGGDQARNDGQRPRVIHPQTRWPGETDAAPALAGDGTAPDEMFGILKELLASRRQLLGKLGHTEQAVAHESFIATPDDVRSVLNLLQQRPVTPVSVDGAVKVRSINHVKQDLLAQLRQISPEGQAARLPPEESDAIDLVGMLFDHIMKDVRPNSPAAGLLAKLQVPLLRVAMDDLGFFVRSQHPARQMLNTIAETGAQWLGDEEGDRTLIEKMQLLVDRAVHEFNGDPTLFQALQEDLNTHMQAAVHRSETAERRHVEAARGKERLALAQKRASELISEKLDNRKVPRFVRTLLTQAWADVLALTLLRQGEDSDIFRQQLTLADRLVAASTAEPGSGEALSEQEAGEMEQEIGRSLGQVGYHDEDARAIARRLVSREEQAGEDDAASRTELALRLKSRNRLGSKVIDKKASRQPALNSAELEALEQIKQLPFGTWFEFTIESGGERVRRRLSWYSPVTGHALFVNHRGQRVGEHTIDWLARALASGKIAIVQSEAGTLIDRAWGAIIGALRSLSGKPTNDAPGADHEH